MSELDVLAANMQWLRDNMEKNDKLLADIFDRLRHIENELASIQANQKPPMNGWAIFGIIATVTATVLLVLDRIYVNQ